MILGPPLQPEVLIYLGDLKVDLVKDASSCESRVPERMRVSKPNLLLSPQGI